MAVYINGVVSAGSVWTKLAHLAPAGVNAISQAVTTYPYYMVIFNIKSAAALTLCLNLNGDATNLYNCCIQTNGVLSITGVQGYYKVCSTTAASTNLGGIIYISGFLNGGGYIQISSSIGGQVTAITGISGYYNGAASITAISLNTSGGAVFTGDIDIFALTAW